MLRVRLLGGLHVDGVDVARLGSRKARTLVARLAVAGGEPVGTGALIDVLWPDGAPAHPGDQLSVLASRARAALGADRLPRAGGGYALRADWVDLAALDELAAEARARLAAGSVAPARAAAQAALDLYRGPLLPEEPADTAWLEVERSALARTLADVRRTAAEAALRGGDPWVAADLAEAALAAEPYDEAALRLLMSAHAAGGRPALALRAYADQARRLADELGVDPAAETRDLHVALLRAAPAPPREVPALPGRAAELATLTAAFDGARAGRAALFSVEGESGIGKTWLLDAWVATLPAEASVLRAAGDELAGGLPFQPLLDALGALLRRAGPDGSAALLAGEAELLGPLVGESANLSGGESAVTPAAITALVGVPAGQSLIFAALDTVVARLAETGPVVLVLDDAHWADRATLAWLQHAVRRLADVALFAVTARWPEEGIALRAGGRLTLGPLDLPDAARLVGLPVDSPEVARLYERTGGHPYFLLELARAAPPADEGDGIAADVPEAVRAAVLDRCDRAGAAAPTLRAAAVLGPDVDLDLLAGVLNRPPSELLDHLEEGVRRHLLIERGTGFGFGHQLVRDALCATSTAGRAALLHRDAARCLADRPRTDPLEVAYHARLGGDAALAATALARAADVALSRYDHAGALRLLDEALTIGGPDVDLLVRRARGYLLLRQDGPAAEDAAAAIAAGAGAEARAVAAIAAYQARDFPRAIAFAEEGGRLATDPDLQASCLAIAGRVRHSIGDLAGAQRLLGEACGIASPATRPVLDVWLAYVRVHQGDPGPGLLLGAVPEPAATVGPLHALPFRHLAEGHARAIHGEPLAALDAFTAMDEAARRQHTDRFVGRADNFRGWILRNLGEHAEARDHNAKAYEESIAAGNMEPAAHALLDLADGEIRGGDPAAAAALLAQARAIGEAHAFAWRNALRERLLAGRAALATRHALIAADIFAGVRDDAARIGVDRYGVLARVWLARARRLAGDRVTPDELADDVLRLDRVAALEAWWLTADLASELDVDAWRALALDRVARLAAAAGPYAAALRRRATSLG